MRYFYDTEFIEDGKTIDLISIGVVAEDGREFYRVSFEFDPERANEWVKQNVLVHLPSPPTCENGWSSRSRIKEELLAFCDVEKHGKPEFWGYYSAYDHVALCQLFGIMMDLPNGWPYYTRDLRQWADSLGFTEPLDQYVKAENEHHALADAQWNRRVWYWLKQREYNLVGLQKALE